jgi:hypothetical protein
MSQYVFVIGPPDEHGVRYCKAFLALRGDLPVAESLGYSSGTEALNDVIEQIGIRTNGQSDPSGSVPRMPSAAAGGRR